MTIKGKIAEIILHDRLENQSGNIAGRKIHYEPPEKKNANPDAHAESAVFRIEQRFPQFLKFIPYEPF
jgi:hypothetical protein